MTVEELADWLGYEVAEILGLVVQNQAVKVTVAEAVSNAITANVVAWAISKINPPPELEIALGLIDGDDLVPVYKPQYDPQREDYLGKLDWWGVQIGGGSIRIDVDGVDGSGLSQEEARQKVKVYKSPAKGAPALSWGDVIEVESPGAVRNFYVEGIDPSGSLKDLEIKLIYVPEKASISGLISSELSPSAELTVYDVRFQEDQAFEGFDDNSEGELQIPALMVPLGANHQPGTNTVKVAVQPSGLHNLFELAAVNPSPVNGDISINNPGPLASSSVTVTVTGRVHNTESELQVLRSSDDLVVARLWTDVKKRIENARDIDLFLVLDPQEPNNQHGLPDFPSGFSEAALEDFLNNKTWGKQANVFLDVVQRRFRSIDYDDDNPTNGLDIGGENSGENSEQFAIVSNTFQLIEGNLQIFVVNEFKYLDGSHMPAAFHRIRTHDNQQSVIYVNENVSSLPLYAHEIGHDLGLNGVPGEGHSVQSPSDIMFESTFNLNDNRLRIRRIDWNTANP